MRLADSPELRESGHPLRTVAKGVIGVAFIQAVVVGLCLPVAGVPWAGALSAIVLVLGIAQVPALIVTLPAIIDISSSGDDSTVAAVTYSVLLFAAGMTDNLLKPLMLGRGVDAAMPVILPGARVEGRRRRVRFAGSRGGWISAGLPPPA